MSSTFTNIDEYIDGAPAEFQAMLTDLRDIIRAAAPDATEKISYQMPTFWQGRNLIHFAAMKSHVGLYPGGEAVAHFADRLGDYVTSKGTIRLPLDRPVDRDLITDIVRWRVDQEAARGLK